MRRRDFIKTVGAGFAASVGNSCFGMGKMSELNKKQRPNFVIMYTDDQRWNTIGKIQGHPMLRDANLDRLADTGVLFENAFVPTPICVCSRACLASGRYTRNHRVHRFHDHLPADVRETTYHSLLKKAGYRTGCLGKWGMGINDQVTGMFDLWDAWANQGEYFHDIDGKKVHNGDWLADKTDEFLKGCNDDQPFCITVNYKAPHAPFEPDPRDEHIFDDTDIPREKTDTPEHFEKLPEHVQDSYLKVCYDVYCGPEKYQDFIKDYLGCVASIDRSVGRIVNSLEKYGFSENTVVIFLSDHGMFLGDHGVAGKWLLREESIRTPMLINYSKLPSSMKGQRLGQMVLNIDVAPTILSMANLQIPAKMDGEDLSPLLNGKKTKWRKDFLMEHYVAPSVIRKPIPRSEGVRTERWKYFRYTDVEPNIEKLFDLENDPLEENNLANNSKYSKVLKAMRTRFAEYEKKYPQTYAPDPYHKRAQSGEKSIDLEKFKRAKPKVHEKLVKYMEENEVTFEQIMTDKKQRNKACTKLGYWF